MNDLKTAANNNQPSINRRKFLGFSGSAIAGLLAPTSIALPKAKGVGVLKQLAGKPQRELSFYHLHTGERLKTTYWQQGEYASDALADINKLFRDHRKNQQKTIDTKLINQLFALRETLGSDAELHIVSAYRSPATNEALRQTSDGVAKFSYHMKGQAIDFYIPGVSVQNLRKAGLQLGAGGVGYYPRSGFVHLDTGRLRNW